MFSSGAPGPLLSLHLRLHCWDWISWSPVLDAGLFNMDGAIPSMRTDRCSIYSLFVCYTLSAKIIKEAIVAAADSLFQDFINKPEISSIKALPLSRSTVTHRC